MPVESATPVAMNDASKEQFERQGYLCPVRVLDDVEVKHYLSCYMDYVRRNKERLDALPPNQKYQVLSETHFLLPWVSEIVSHPRILNAVEVLLGPNLLAWNTNWFTKMPGEKTYVSWHQDGTYWNLVPPMVVTAWVALSPSVSCNGCMRVIPGTHKRPMMPQRETHLPDNMLSRGQEISVDVDEKSAVDLSLRPGEMSLHHIWIVHGSNANTSADVPRIGIAMRYTKPEVKQESPFKPMAMLVRGRDTFGNFQILPPPRPGSHRQQAYAHREIVDRIRAGVMTSAQRQS